MLRGEIHEALHILSTKIDQVMAIDTDNQSNVKFNLLFHQIEPKALGSKVSRFRHFIEKYGGVGGTIEKSVQGMVFTGYQHKARISRDWAELGPTSFLTSNTRNLNSYIGCHWTTRNCQYGII